VAVSTLEELLADGVEGRGVLVRSDLNVPLDDDGQITDPGRIIASVPTLKALSDAGAKVVVTAHLGRPKGGPEPKFSLAPVAAALGEQLGRHVQLAGDVVGSDALARAEGLTDGDVLLLENIRFDPRETSKDDAERLALAKALVELVGDDGAFVSDGFGVVHRKQASVYDVATLLPHYAGTLVAGEIKVLEQLTSSTERPYAVVLGGSKVSDKLAVIESLAKKADSLIIGGGMCFTFLAAQGVSVGTSLLQDEMIDTCRKLLEDYGDVIHLPVDIVVAAEFSADSPPEKVFAGRIPEGKMGLDIGPGSVKGSPRCCPTPRPSSGTVRWVSSSSRPTRRAPRVSRRPSSGPPQRARSAWSAAATRRLPSGSSACPTTGSRTFPPAVGHRSNTLRARRCPVSQCSSSPDHLAAVHHLGVPCPASR